MFVNSFFFVKRTVKNINKRFTSDSKRTFTSDSKRTFGNPCSIRIIKHFTVCKTQLMAQPYFDLPKKESTPVSFAEVVLKIHFDHLKEVRFHPATKFDRVRRLVSELERALWPAVLSDKPSEHKYSRWSQA